MVGRTQGDQQRAARDFFRAELKNLDSATKAVLKSTAKSTERQIKREIRRSFKKGPDRTKGGFFKAVRVYDFGPRGSLGPASIVRLSVPFMRAFEEGSTASGKPNLIILLPDGARLKYKRISKGNTWRDVWRDLKSKHARIIKVANGFVVAVEHQGRSRAIYKIQRQVRIPKKISVLKIAEKLAASMPDEVIRLLEGG